MHPLVFQSAENFRNAPRWRFTVFATALCAFIGIAYFPRAGVHQYGNSSTALQTVQPAGYNPASDTALQAFTATANRFANESRAGYRCDQILAALEANGISQNDRARAAAQSSPAAAAAQAPLMAAANCAKRISVSDAHFDSIARAVPIAAYGHDVKSVEEAAAAIRALDGFDRSRDRMATDSDVLTKARAYAEEIDASNRKIAAFTSAADKAVNDPSATASLALAETLSALTDFDRSRLTPSQQQTLPFANETRLTIAASRSRFSNLAGLVAAADAVSGSMGKGQLLAATAGIPATS